MRGSESNHTLVLLNGIAINDQSTTNGLHDFGQDLYKLFNKLRFTKDQTSDFGPDAIGGAINFITDVDYSNSYSLSGLTLITIQQITISLKLPKMIGILI